MSQDSQRDILVRFEGPAAVPGQGSRVTRWAPLVLLAGLVAGGAAAVPRLADRPEATDPAAACTRFVTPATASAGEWIPVLAYRHRDRKGPLEIRFDATPVSYRLIRYAASTTPHVTELFLTVGVPAAAARGRHEIQLHEPAATPGAAPERLAAATITLGP